jgi:hypothetical protein
MTHELFFNVYLYPCENQDILKVSMEFLYISFFYFFVILCQKYVIYFFVFQIKDIKCKGVSFLSFISK